MRRKGQPRRHLAVRKVRGKPTPYHPRPPKGWLIRRRIGIAEMITPSMLAEPAIATRPLRYTDVPTTGYHRHGLPNPSECDDMVWLAPLSKLRQARRWLRGMRRVR